MTRAHVLSAAAGAALLLSPALGLAQETRPAPANDASSVDMEQEILESLEGDAIAPVPAPIPDGRGGGGTGFGPIYPYGSAGVTVDATVTREITPDFISLNAYCEAPRGDTREEIRDALMQLYTDIKNAVGRDGQVRRVGTIGIYPVYGAAGQETSTLTGNISIYIRITNPASASRISDYVEMKGCGVSWDVRLTDTVSHELSILDDLTSRLNKRKTIFEKLLGKRLTRVVSANINTWVDGYTTYDPERNRAEATTNLVVTFDIGNRATLPSSSSASPRG